MSVCLSVYPSIYLPIYPSIHPSHKAIIYVLYIRSDLIILDVFPNLHDPMILSLSINTHPLGPTPFQQQLSQLWDWEGFPKEHP